MKHYFFITLIIFSAQNLLSYTYTLKNCAGKELTIIPGLKIIKWQQPKAEDPFKIQAGQEKTVMSFDLGNTFKISDGSTTIGAGTQFRDATYEFYWDPKINTLVAAVVGTSDYTKITSNLACLR